MKFALIAVGLLAIISQVPPAFGRAGGMHAEDPWNPQHINGLPPEIRSVLGHMCASPRAQHQFAGYFQNSWDRRPRARPKKVGRIFGPRRWISAVPDWR